MKILVSACLLGDNCKYNGGNNYNQKVIDYIKGNEIIKICPELLAGMSTPRKCAEIVDGKVMDSEDNNVDNEYRHGVNMALGKIKNDKIDLCILQSRSPTCGVNQIYDGTFSGNLINGSGLFAKELIDKGIKVVDCEDI